MRTEAEIIELIRKCLPSPQGDKAWLRLGPGDDAALVRGGASRGKGGKLKPSDWVLSCDQFLEGVHFLARIHPPEVIGYKALARATSDLAAMGAVPRFFMLSLAVPPRRAAKWLDAFLKGMARAAREFKMVLIGGDTSAFSSVLVNLTVGGQTIAGSARNRTTDPGTVLTRGGARPGDLIYVSGVLGAAQLGLELVLRGLIRKTRGGLAPRDPRLKPFLEAHMEPKIQIALGRWLAGENPWGLQIASAAIDTSDGLSTDLGHVCEASGVGARIWAKELPTVRIPDRLEHAGFDPLKLALHGGEDYQLIFTVPARTARHLPKSYRSVQITRIGEIVPLGRRSNEKVGMNKDKSSRGNQIELIDAAGGSSRLQPHGWDPFRTGR